MLDTLQEIQKSPNHFLFGNSSLPLSSGFSKNDGTEELDYFLSQILALELGFVTKSPLTRDIIFGQTSSLIIDDFVLQIMQFII